MAVWPSSSLIVLTICCINKSLLALSLMALHIRCRSLCARESVQVLSVTQRAMGAELTRIIALKNDEQNKQIQRTFR